MSRSVLKRLLPGDLVAGIWEGERYLTSLARKGCTDLERLWKEDVF